MSDFRVVEKAASSENSLRQYLQRFFPGYEYNVVGKRPGRMKSMTIYTVELRPPSQKTLAVF